MSKHLKIHVNRDSVGKYCVSLGGHPLRTTRIAGAKPTGSISAIFEFYVDTQTLKRALQEFESDNAPSIEAAYEMGAKGGPAVEAERLAFEAWMRGHCWALCAEWTGSQYIGSSEQDGDFCQKAMMTRKLWAAWRDRAALTPAIAQEPTNAQG